MNSVAAVSLCMITEIVLADLQQVQLSPTPEGKPPPNELSSPRTLLQAEAQSESTGCGVEQTPDRHLEHLGSQFPLKVNEQGELPGVCALRRQAFGKQGGGLCSVQLTGHPMTFARIHGCANWAYIQLHGFLEQSRSCGYSVPRPFCVLFRSQLGLCIL